MKSNTPNISTKEIENAVQNIQAAICAKFSDLFSKDFDLYTLHLIDNLYDKIDIINSEWKTMPTEHNCNTELIQQIQNLIQKAIELRDSLNSFKSKYKKQFSTKISEDLRPSYMNDIYEFSKQKRNDPIFYTQNKNDNDNDNGDKIWREFKESAKLLKEIIIDLQNILTNLFCIEDNNIKEIISKLNQFQMTNITTLINNIRYPASIHFNLESALIFMFVDYKLADNRFSSLIKKYETLFNNLYTTLKKEFSKIDDILFPMHLVNYEESLEGYIGLPEDLKFIENQLSVFKLKELIALQKFYAKISSKDLSDNEKKLLDQFYTILSYTKLPYIAYNLTLNNLPDYIMDTLHITQSDLVKLLGVNKSTISRQRNANTLIENNKWFWVAAAGYTYEFLNGETTITNYGKPMDNYDNKYLIAPAVRLAHGDLFLKFILNLKDYRAQLSKTNSKRKTNILQQKKLIKISQKAAEIAKPLRKCRDYIDTLCEKERNEDMINVINKYNGEIISYSQEATNKFILYVEIFYRMLDALQDNHLRKIYTEIYYKDEIHILNLIEHIMDLLSKYMLEFIECLSKENDEITISNELRNSSKIINENIIKLKSILDKIINQK